MGSPCLFTRQRSVKMGYFYWLRVKNSNHLHTELSLAYLKDVKFYLESKASFIDKSSIIASFKLFLIAWLRECRNLSRRRVASCVSASKRGSSFCSLSQLNLQNDSDPIHFASFGNEQSIQARVFVL